MSGNYHGLESTIIDVYNIKMLTTCLPSFGSSLMDYDGISGGSRDEDQKPYASDRLHAESRIQLRVRADTACSQRPQHSDTTR